MTSIKEARQTLATASWQIGHSLAGIRSKKASRDTLPDRAALSLALKKYHAIRKAHPALVSPKVKQVSFL
jgi:hypothetical protein